MMFATINQYIAMIVMTTILYIGQNEIIFGEII